MSIPMTSLVWNASRCVCGHDWSRHTYPNLGCAYCPCGHEPAKLTIGQAEERFMGRLVMVERVDPTNEHSAYHDGQYLVITATPSQLMGINTVGNTTASRDGFSVYALGCGFKGLPLVGKAAYRVISVDEPGEWVDRQLNLAETEISDVREGRRKAAWVHSVYDRAEAVIPTVRKALNVARREARVARAADAADAILVNAVLTASVKTTEDKRAADRAKAAKAATDAATALWSLFEAYLKAGFTRAEAMQLLNTSMTVSTANAAPNTPNVTPSTKR